MRSSLYAILLLTSVGLSWILMQWLSPPGESPKLAENNHRDGYMLNVTLRYFDQNGELDSELQSPKVEHYPIDDKMVIQKPKMTYFNPKGKNNEKNI